MLFSENNLLKAGKARFFNLSVFSVFSSYHTVTIANIEDKKSKLKLSPSPAPQPTHTATPEPVSASAHQGQPPLSECARDPPWL